MKRLYPNYRNCGLHYGKLKSPNDLFFKSKLVPYNIYIWYIKTYLCLFQSLVEFLYPQLIIFDY